MLAIAPLQQSTISTLIYVGGIIAPSQSTTNTTPRLPYACMVSQRRTPPPHSVFPCNKNTIAVTHNQCTPVLSCSHGRVSVRNDHHTKLCSWNHSCCIIHSLCTCFTGLRCHVHACLCKHIRKAALRVDVLLRLCQTAAQEVQC